MAKAKKSAEKKTTDKKPAEHKKKKESGSNWSEPHQSNVVVHQKDESEQPGKQ